MDRITSWCGILLDNWLQATPMDYTQMILAVVLSGWFIGRYIQR